VQNLVACVFLTLSAASAHADWLMSGEVTPNSEIRNAFVAFYPNACGTHGRVAPWPNVFGANDTTPFQAILVTNLDLVNQYSFFGLYNSGDGEGVVLTMNQEAAGYVIGKKAWSDLYPYYNEADIVNAIHFVSGHLETDDGWWESSELLYDWSISNLALSVDDNYSVYANPHFGEEAVLVGFSTGTDLGTMKVESVPEPATLFALGLGSIALLRRKRKV